MPSRGPSLLHFTFPRLNSLQDAPKGFPKHQVLCHAPPLPLIQLCNFVLLSLLFTHFPHQLCSLPRMLPPASSSFHPSQASFLYSLSLFSFVPLTFPSAFLHETSPFFFFFIPLSHFHLSPICCSYLSMLSRAPNTTFLPPFS